VLASEPSQDAQWNEGFVNEITGSDRLSARHPRGKPFSFDPTHKLMMHANSVPDLKGAPSGIRRRLRIALFDHAPLIADPTLKDKLRVEWPAILRWMIDGCLEWQSDGLKPPEAVTVATNEYFEQQDTFARFVADCCNLLPGARLPPDKLRIPYNAWAVKNGEEPQSSKTFYNTVKLCRLPHVSQKKVHGTRWIFGIALKPSPPPKDNDHDPRDDEEEPVAPITSEEKEELIRRGFSEHELFAMPPEQAREILANPHQTAASVPFMITNAMKAELRKRGYSAADIAQLTPAQAHEILSEDAF
jgi:phage/plasmid-associated DNA primase